MPPKSILKKPSATVADGAVDNSVSDPAAKERHREVATYHAHLLQGRKNVESRNLAAIEELMEFPIDPSGDPLAPDPSDEVRFKQLVQTFQPSDYDELFVERNCVGKCGYVFCPRPNRKLPGGGIVHLELGKKGKDAEFWPSKSIERWCTNQCARRALYVKVQLDEKPAWERASDQSQLIELLNEDADRILAGRLQDISLDKQEEGTLNKAMEELALERGERSDSRKPDSVMRDDVRENRPNGAPAPAVIVTNAPGSIEGHVPSVSSERHWLEVSSKQPFAL